jgi:hypothetical protein
MDIVSVIEANRARQKRARELNIRAGEDLFKVFSKGELLEFTLRGLAGARRMEEVADSSALLLPELCDDLVLKVQRDNPDEIVVLGEPRKVVYRGVGHAPRIVFGDQIRSGHLWRQLPDEIVLPSGKKIEVVVQFGINHFCSTEVGSIKDSLLDYANRCEWDRFRSAEKPEITLPDPTMESSQVPEVREYQYGTCVVTNQPLVAFGTVAVKQYHYYNEPEFEVRWCQRMQEAEEARSVAEEKLFFLRKEIMERKQVEIARQEAVASKERVKDVYGFYQSFGRDREIREKLYLRAYGYIPERLDDIRRWTLETDILAEMALGEISEAKKAAQEREEKIAPLVSRVGQHNADFVIGLVRELVQFMGAKTAHERLSTESVASYGRVRKQSALASVCIGENGRRFLALNQSRSVDEILAGVIFWLEHEHNLQPIEHQSVSLSPSPPKPSAPKKSLGNGFGSLADAFGDLKL